MATNYVYKVGFSGISHCTAITLAQIKAPTCCAFEIIRAHIFQYGGTTSLQERIALVRKTTRATIPSFTPIALACGLASYGIVSSCSNGSGIATNEGSNGNTLVEAGFNVLNGWEHLPTPEERITVEPGEGVGLTFLTAPTAEVWSGAIYFRELR